MPELARQGKTWFGGYANAYGPVPADWVMDGTKPTDGKLTLRADLSPDAYAAFARRWCDQGATIIGGCCGIGPDHLARIRRIVDGED
jgi:S-methylmethionine-dependent homocysteine/selenocysteine methylase